MGLVRSVIKVAAIALATKAVTLYWEQRLINKLLEDLEKLADDSRSNPKRPGTVAAYVRVMGDDMVEETVARLYSRASEADLRKRVEIFLDSIPD